MSYSANLEHIYGPIYFARVYAIAEPTYGDPYIWFCVIKRIEPSFFKKLLLRLLGKKIEVTAFLMGVTKSLSAEAAATLRDTLLAEGYTRRKYERWKNGKLRVFELKL